jgi:hypothetical protein
VVAGVEFDKNAGETAETACATLHINILRRGRDNVSALF